MSNDKNLSNIDRKPFFHDGKLVYEWSQLLDDIHIYVKLPTLTTTSSDLNVIIQPNRISIGLKNNSPYLDNELWSTVDSNESLWYIDGDEIHLECNKVKKGEVWLAAFKNHGTVDPFYQQELQKKLMLERFQQEHPGFDFSNAKFSGNAPDPRTFMGGVTYK